MKYYDTVVETINALKQKGFITDFNIAFDKLLCSENNICLNPGEFEIVEVHRFEGESNPADEDVVYAVQSLDGKIKGIVTSAFGVYADPISDALVKKLSMHPNP